MTFKLKNIFNRCFEKLRQQQWKWKWLFLKIIMLKKLFANIPSSERDIFTNFHRKSAEFYLFVYMSLFFRWKVTLFLYHYNTIKYWLTHRLVGVCCSMGWQSQTNPGFQIDLWSEPKMKKMYGKMNLHGPAKVKKERKCWIHWAKTLSFLSLLNLWIFLEGFKRLV